MDSQSFCSFLFVFSFYLICFSVASCLEFTYPPASFDPNDANVIVRGSTRGQSEFGEPVIRLIDPDPVTGTRQNASGRVYYHEPFQLWDPRTNMITDFTTSFDFAILFGEQQYNSSVSSGGVALFITSEESLTAPRNSGGGWLGLFNETINGNSSNQIVAVELDTFRNEWDPSNIHIGFDVNSIDSKNSTNWNEDLVSNSTYHRATLSYNGTSKALSIVVELADIFGQSEALSLTYNVDLSTVLPPKVYIGFSASSGQATPAQLIISWNFTSNMSPIEEGDNNNKGFEMWKVWLIIAVVVFFVGVGLIVGILWRNSRRKKPDAKEEDYHDEELGIDDSMDMDFAKGTGPKRFTFKALVSATGNFSEEGKLGQGGFGGVYRGYLAEENTEIAVKKIASNSNQGKKEYVSEVKTISRLRHRNLVQLIGWSHENANFLLVYEYMPNGSLDTHLYGKGNRLPWPIRYKIVKGLASALLYLHEEWEQCVIHRDVKPSNIMLDSNFNAKLGDFGLAKLLEHGLGSQTTILAGTMGYLAPEYVITSKASKESDVFSFGVVALEVACGRRAVENNKEETKMVLSNWIWELHANGKLLEAVDQTLNGEFNEDEMRCLLSVGLWCTHTDYKLRPSIRQAIQALNFEVPLPILPPQMPMALYFPPVVLNQFDFTNTYEARSQATCSTATTSNPSTLFECFHPISSSEEVSALVHTHGC
ncbi:L-type lectin-domain containing receptor kinase IX.1-like [Durio zibethinus]|uniref:non-specific serine/threonine protein kinase n=1 Tax=Durio zibethinus TaxID=66656 RepID=A0A6P6AC12_DURZI|nr:L-type lectin-domain containing receptor kinase IX.1-like [Durio zibethinus]